jgi:hypothetical protein
VNRLQLFRELTLLARLVSNYINYITKLEFLLAFIESNICASF